MENSHDPNRWFYGKPAARQVNPFNRVTRTLGGYLMLIECNEPTPDGGSVYVCRLSYRKRRKP